MSRGFLVDNGKRGPLIGTPFRLRFSSDSRRLAYATFVEGGCRVVVDGEPGPCFEGSCTALVFSRNGRNVVYQTSTGRKVAVAVDHRPGKAYDDVLQLSLSDDGRTVAYLAREGERWKAVVGTEESEPAEGVAALAVGERGGVAWIQRDQDRNRLFLNGRCLRESESRLECLAINQDGTKVAFLEEGRIVDGDFRGDKVDSLDPPVFAPDGRTLVTKASFGGRPFLVVGGKKRGPMKAWSPLAFDDEATRVAVVAEIGREIWRKVLPLRS
jgi:hypothetical protein